MNDTVLESRLGGNGEQSGAELMQRIAMVEKRIVPILGEVSDPESRSTTLTESVEELRRRFKWMFGRENDMVVEGLGFTEDVSLLLLENFFRHQELTDEMEVPALRERTGGYGGVVAEVVNWRPNGAAHSTSDYGTIYCDGPNLIAVVGTEKDSHYRQAGEILQTALEPFFKLNGRSIDIKSVILFGSTVSEPRLPGDLDILVLYRRFESELSRKELEELSPRERDLYFSIYDMDAEKHGGNFKEKFKLVGDTITANHSLEITVEPVDRYLGNYGLSGEELQSQLRLYEQLAQEKEEQGYLDEATKIRKYLAGGLNFSQVVPKMGAVIVFGESPKDLNGDDIFLRRDDELLNQEKPKLSTD